MTRSAPARSLTGSSIATDISGLDESKADFLSTLMERSVANVKSLVESET